MLKRMMLWVFVIMAAVLVFSFSTESGKISQDRSHKITRIMIRESEHISTLKFDKTRLDNERINFYIRKTGHVLEYLALSLALSLAINNGRPSTYKAAAVILLICLLCASADEFMQLHIAGRSGRAKDVMIDSIGILGGIITYNIGNAALGFVSKMLRSLGQRLQSDN